MGRTSNGGTSAAVSARKRAKRQTAKAPNRFKFQTFKEQLSEISIESIRRTGGWRGTSLPSESSSWFEEAMMEWRELNCTTHFARFCGQVMPMVGSLAQMVFHQAEIKRALIEHLSVEGSLAVRPLAALTAMLARDLMSDFGLDTFRQLFFMFVRICNSSQVVEDIGAVMKTLFYLSKVMEKQLVGDLAKTFEEVFAPVLVPSKSHTLQMLIELWSTLAHHILLKGRILEVISAFGSQRDDKRVVAAKILVVSCFDGKKQGKLMSKHLKSIISGLNDISDKMLIRCLSRKLIEYNSSSLKSLVEILNDTVDRESQDGQDLLIGIAEDICVLRNVSDPEGSLLSLISSSEKACDVACKLLGKPSVDLQFVLKSRPVLMSIFTLSLASSRHAIITLLSMNRTIEFVGALFSTCLIEKIIAESFSTSPVESMRLLLACRKSKLVSSFRLDYSPILEDSLDVEAVCLALQLTDVSISPTAILAISKRLFGSLDHTAEVIGLLEAWKVTDDLVGIEELVSLIIPSSHHSTVLCLLSKLCVDQVKDSLFKPAKEGLLSGDHNTRASALQLLHHLVDFPLLKTLDSLESGSAWSFNSDREKGIHLNTLWHSISTLSIEEADLAMRHLVGIILGGFKPLQNETGKVLNGFAQKYGSLFRQVILEAIAKLNQTFCVGYGPFAFGSLCEFFAQHTASLEYCKIELVNLLLSIYTDHTEFTETFVRQVETSLAPALNAISNLKHLDQLALSSDLQDLLLKKFLPMGDAIIQKRALDAYHSIAPISARDQLSNLLESEQIMRETLVNLSSLPLLDVDVTIRIVYGRMIARRGASAGRTSPKTRRKLLLNYVSTWNSQDIGAFIKFVQSTPNEVASERIVGFLTLLEPVFTKLARFTPSPILSDTISMITGYLGSEEKNIRRLSLLRIYQLWSIQFNSSLTSDNILETVLMQHHEQIWSILLQRFQRLADEYGQHTSSALLDLLSLWSANRPHLIMSIVDSLCVALGAVGKVKNSVAIRVVQIIDPLVTEMSEQECHMIVEAISTRLAHIITGTSSNDSTLLQKLIDLLLQVSGRVEPSSSTAGPLVELLLGHFSSLLKLKRRSSVVESTLTAILNVLSKLVPGYAQLDVLGAYKQCSSWFGSTNLRTRTSRESLCALFTTICTRINDPALNYPELAVCLSDLNAFEPDVLDDEPDFDKRQQGFYRLKSIASSVDPSKAVLWWLPVLALSMHGLLDPEELATRTQALFLIDSLLDNHSKSLATSEDAWNALVIGQIWNNIKKYIKIGKDDTIRSGLITLLAKLVQTFPSTNPFNQLEPLLASGDEEANILINLGHIQVHRRTRATRRLGEFASSSSTSLDRSVIEDIFLSYLWSWAIPSDPESVVDAHLQTEAIHTSAILIARLPVKTIMSRFVGALKKLQNIKSDDDPQKKRKLPASARALLRFISALVSSVNPNIDDLVGESMITSLFESALNPANTGATHLQLVESIGILLAPRQSLLARFLPKLMATLCQGLRDRDADAREASRSALCRLIGRLGSDYLWYALNELQAILIPSSHSRIKATYGSSSIGSNSLFNHVHGYTVASLVETLNDACSFSDDTFLSLLHVALDHGIGQLATEKVTGQTGASGQEWHGRAVEARSQKSYKLLQSLVKSSTLPQLLSLLQSVAKAVGSVDIDLGQVDQCFAAIQGGIAKLNLSKELVVILYELVQQKTPTCSSEMEVNSNKFALLGIDCLVDLLKSNDKEILEFLTPMLDGFINPLISVHVASSKHIQLTTSAIKFVTLLIGTSAFLPSFNDAELISKFIGRLFELLVKTDAALQQQLVSSTLRCISAAVRHLPIVTLTDSQTRALLAFTRDHLEHVSSGNSAIAFALVKTLLSRKVLLVELLELMRTVGEKLVVAHDSSVRAQCRSVYTSFLLEYPLGPEKIKDAMSTLVKNMSAFEWDTGRLSCIQTLSILVPRLPAEVIAEWSSLVLVSIASRIGIEPNEGCKKALLNLVTIASARLSSDPSLNQPLQEATTLIRKWIAETSKASVILAAWKIAAPFIQGLTSDPFSIKPFLTDQVNRELSSDTKMILPVIECAEQLNDQELFCEIKKLLEYPAADVRFKVNNILLTKCPLDDVLMFKAFIKQIVELPGPSEQNDIETLVKCALSSITSTPSSSQDIADQFNFLEKHVKQCLSDPSVIIENRATISAILKLFAGFLVTVGEINPTWTCLDPLASIAIRISTCDHLSATTSSSIERALSESIRTSAQQLLELLQASLSSLSDEQGNDAYTSLTQRVIQSAARSKAQRKAAMSQLAVNDPEAYARRKLGRNAAKKEQRKRKVDKTREVANKRHRSS